MKKVKVGVIGTGFIGPAHIEALRRLGYVDVVAIADVDERTARQKADMLGIETAYGDYKNLLADSEIGVVHICTPNNLHYPMSKEALLAGKHVVCEKPLAMQSDEARELVQIAAEKKLANATHFNIRFYPLIHHIKEMIGRGDLGEIFAVNGSYQQDWLFLDTDYNWRLEPELSGNSRAIADIGSHWFDSIEFMTGKKVNRVFADFATFHPIRKKPLKPIETYSGKMLSPEDYQEVPISTEDYASVLIHFDNGARGSLVVNQVAAGRKNRMFFEIYGSNASVQYNTESPNELWIGYREKNNELLIRDPSLLYTEARDIVSFPGGHNEGFPDTSKQFFAKFYKYILEEGYKKDLVPAFPTFVAGLRELELCESVVESARSEKWISL